MVEFLDLKAVTALHSEEINQAVRQVVDSGWYLQGETVKAFEQEYAAYIGTRNAVTCANGLDALICIYQALLELGRLKPGDEVIVPANTYIASILAISENGLVPVLVEPRMDTLEIDPDRIEAAITERTRSVLIVHLYGRCAYDCKIEEICRTYDLFLVEDNAQAHGCLWQGRRTGSLGHAAGHSFYPGKNLGALGDAGAVTTDDDRLAEVVRAVANYGSSRKYVFDYRGRNSRMDEVQAAALRVKLKYLDSDNARRLAVARSYRAGICNPMVKIPPETPEGQNVYHLFPIFCECRDDLQSFLKEAGIQTLIHYPIPPHKQACYWEWNGSSYPVTEMIHRQELSLPISQVMTQVQVEQVIDAVNRFQ